MQAWGEGGRGEDGQADGAGELEGEAGEEVFDGRWQSFADV